MNKLIFALYGGTVTVPLGYVVYRLIRNHVRRERGKRAFRGDMSGVNSGNRCSACGGTATKLYLREDQDAWFCTNWHLCDMTQVYQGMLRDVESA